jgi:hypothetical protein
MMGNPLKHIGERVQVPAAEREPGETSRWVAIVNAEDKVTGYLELFWGDHCGWVTVPGASRIIEAGSERPQ